MPGQGLFLGDLLTRPWGTVVSEMENGDRSFVTTELKPGVRYLLAGSNSPGDDLELINYISLSGDAPKITQYDLPQNFSYYYLLPREHLS